MAVFFDLPTELVLRILLLLDLSDILSCQLTHTSLHAIIKDSIFLKYLSALKVAGMVDNRLCSVETIPQRLDMLNRREHSWTAHEFYFSKEIYKLPCPYGMNGGMYFYGDDRGPSLHYFSLPSTISDKPRWGHIDIGTPIINIGLAIYEHDLIAIATSVPSDNGSNMETFNVLLFEASTGNPHPLAQNPNISIGSPLRSRLGVTIEISGDHLAILITAYVLDPKDYMYVYNWKTGSLRMTSTNPRGTYAGALFLSPKVLLLPNKKLNTFEFWPIPETLGVEPRTSPSGALELPPFRHDFQITDIQCECEPCFQEHNILYSSHPFHSSTADAIAAFHIHISRGAPSELMYTMFVHRKSLLKLCSVFSPPPSTSQYLSLTPWDIWGPAVTRLVQRDTLWPGWISASAGQRSAFSSNTDIKVLDFNPIRIRHLKATSLMRNGKSLVLKDNATHPSVRTDESHLEHFCLEKPVISKLPYMSHTFRNTGAFEEVMIDDERLIGHRYGQGPDGSLEIELKVLHIGHESASSVLRREN